MVNIDFLDYMVAFAKTQNLTKASETLHISQSALTRAMQKLEQEIGVPLFRRSRNKLELNDTGKLFVQYAERVLQAEREMVTETVAYHNAASRISVGMTAMGPMLHYGPMIYNTFADKSIAAKIDALDNLRKGLDAGAYDFLFIDKEIATEEIESRFIFTEKLYVSVPRTHFVAGLTEGVRFAEIDGQSFLVADNLGLWRAIIDKYLPHSRFFAQNYDNLSEIVNASTIPTFSTNITIPLRGETDRIDIPILDDVASVDFYITYKKSNRVKLKELLRNMR